MNNTRDYILTAAIVLSLATQSSAQNAKEWFQQRKTQTQYLIDQIVALKVYARTLKQGYDIVDKGLTIVGAIKDGNFSDHKTHFAGLGIVNPSITTLQQAMQLPGFYSKLVGDLKKKEQVLLESDMLVQAERQYVELVFSNLRRISSASKDELERLLSNDQLQLADEGRLSRIELAYGELLDVHFFSRSFFNSTNLLIRQREREVSVVLALENLIGPE